MRTSSLGGVVPLEAARISVMLSTCGAVSPAIPVAGPHPEVFLSLHPTLPEVLLVCAVDT